VVGYLGDESWGVGCICVEIAVAVGVGAVEGGNIGFLT